MRNYIASLIIVLGLVGVSVGASLLSVPAGVITAGVCAVAAGVLLLTGGEESS